MSNTLMGRVLVLALVSAQSTAANKQTFTFGMDVDYPPYAYKDPDTGELTGFGYDIAQAMNSLCSAEIQIDVVETRWADCWYGPPKYIGDKLKDSELDACMTYTHTKGVRLDYVDFSNAILDKNKAAGLLTLLEKDGTPKVHADSNLDGLTIVDVGGWAPTADTIVYVENKCRGAPYSEDHVMVVGDGNDEAMKMLRNGSADAMFVYADQAKNYQCKAEDWANVNNSWNCSLWDGFGTEYAYVQTGQYGYLENGTTLAMAKKGSGVAEAINPCLDRFLQTEEYYNLCEKYNFTHHCFHNEHFPEMEHEELAPYDTPTDGHVTDCSNGYCPCPEKGELDDARRVAAGLVPLMAVAALVQWIVC